MVSIPDELTTLSYDIILIIVEDKFSIINQLKQLGISTNKMLPYFNYLEELGEIKAEVKQDTSIDIEINKLTFNLKNKSDLIVFSDVFFVQVYNYFIGDSKSTIIDIGMNIGLASLYLASRANVENVYSFEPFTETFEQAKENILRNSEIIINKININNIGLGYNNISKSFNYDSNLSSGMDTTGESEINGENLSKVEIRNAYEILAPIVKENKKNKLIMKIDCEGMENEIFKRLDENKLLGCFDLILLESHGGLKNKMEEYLRGNGFLYVSTYNDLINENGYQFAFKLRDK